MQNIRCSYRYNHTFIVYYENVDDFFIIIQTLCKKIYENTLLLHTLITILFYLFKSNIIVFRIIDNLYFSFFSIKSKNTFKLYVVVYYIT